MFTDIDLIFESSVVGVGEAIPNAGVAPGGITDSSETLAIDLAYDSAVAGLIYSDPSVTSMEMLVEITKSFTAAEPTTSADCRVMFELVSMPIILSKLTDATTLGKDMTNAVGNLPTTDIVTITAHGLAVGTPFHFSASTSLVGAAVDTIYYVSSLNMTANAFEFATTRAAALAGGTTVDVTTQGTSTVLDWHPFIHATTGRIPLAALQLGARFVAKFQPYSVISDAGSALGNAGLTVKAPWGSGKGQGASAFGYLPVCNRYLAVNVHITDGNPGTNGLMRVILAPETQSGRRIFPTAVQVL